jgi:hypothetical protein
MSFISTHRGFYLLRHRCRLKYLSWPNIVTKLSSTIHLLGRKTDFYIFSIGRSNTR